MDASTFHDSVARRFSSRRWRLVLGLLVTLATACGGSPSAPSTDVPSQNDVVMSSFFVQSNGRFAGFGPLYATCGTIDKGPAGVDVFLQDLTTIIRDAAGQEILRWSEALNTTPRVIGCFTQHSDPNPAAAVGTSFVVRLTYTVRGQTRTAEVSGPIAKP